MKIGVAQINTVAGDFPANARRLLQAYRECLDGGAQWVLAPELVLSGCESTPALAQKCLQALDYLSGEIKAVPLFLGHPDEAGLSVVSVLVDGGIRATFPRGGIFEWQGHRAGIRLEGDSHELDRPSFIFHFARRRYFDGFRLPSLASSVPVIYCNAVGANRTDIYPGASSAWSGTGECLASLPAFQECCRVIDLASQPSAPPCRDELLDLSAAIMLGIRDAVRKSGYLGATIHDDGSLAARVMTTLAVAALSSGQVEVVSFSELRPGLPSGVIFHRLDASALEATFSSLGAAADPAALESLLLSGFAGDRGHLLLLPATRAGILLGRAFPTEGLAPLAELSSGRIQDLAGSLQVEAGAEEIDPKEMMAHYYAEQGLALEEIVALGYTEHQVLKTIRQIDRSRRLFRPALPGLRLSP